VKEADESLTELRSALAARVVHYDVHDLDASAIRLSVPRAFTQEISRYVFDQSVNGERSWSGIAYGSRFGDDLHNWALFESDGPRDPTVELFGRDDPDLFKAQQSTDWSWCSPSDIGRCFP